MKFKSFTSRGPQVSGELCVESMGRIGNYFFATGWFEGFSPEDGKFEYRFTDQTKAVSPEFSYYRGGAAGAGRTGFLHLFWTNGGHKLEVGQNAPVSLSLQDERRANSGPACQVREISEQDLDGFLAALDSAGSREVWGSRIVIEMMRHFNLSDRSQHIALALARVGWRTLDAMYEEVLSSRSGENTCREHLDFLYLCLLNLEGPSPLPPMLRMKFCERVKEAEIAKFDRNLLHGFIGQLCRIDIDQASELALSVITAWEHDRKQLAAALRHCFPLESQWWIHHALVTDGLGPEQASDALNCAGTAAATQGKTSLAKLCYEAALMVSPDAASAAWNAGWFRAGIGEVERAGKFFGAIGRHYAHTSLSTCWPDVGGLPWPHRAARDHGFTLPAGADEWPRITVVTPSFNQGDYIEETLLSVLNQGYPNLQYIVVDGNSTDGTAEVLERYRHRIDRLIIEPDNGQTEALNKGLRLADGVLVAWLNSDDMYAPGALHAAAVEWLESGADLVAGICAEHIDGRIRLLNRPAGNDTDLNLPQLARIFRYWLKGYYFYQPEAFFSKRMLDQVGLLDETLYYSMDYDLWMRFARAGASLAVVDWPFAFFRRHDAQKTSDMVRSVEEQARVRDKYITLGPDELRLGRLKRMLNSVIRKQAPVLAVCSSRLGVTISPEALREASGHFRVQVVEHPDSPELSSADVILLIAEGPEDVETLRTIRESAPGRPVIGWLLGHHDDMFENHEIAEGVDFLVPAHPASERYLANDQALQSPAVPPGVLRWSAGEAGEWFRSDGMKPRSEALHGEFGEELSASAGVEDFLRKLAALPEGGGIVEQFDFPVTIHGGHCGREAFARRCGHVASLILPTRGETPVAVFEALLAGQIPLVPVECLDLDEVISPELQSTLPVLRFSLSDPSSAVEACRLASGRAAREGPEGAERRHLHALEQHGFVVRLGSILKSVGIC